MPQYTQPFYRCLEPRIGALQVGVVQLQARTPAGFQQTAPVGPDGAIKVTLQVSTLPSGGMHILFNDPLPCLHLVMHWPAADWRVSQHCACHAAQDCLACSGCVTSAETVLLEHQSGEEFLARLADPGTTVVVSLSPQSRAALAAFYGLPPGQAQRRLAGFLKGLGVRAVLDAGAGRDLALLEAAAEFVERYRRAHPEHAGGMPLAAQHACIVGTTRLGGTAHQCLHACIEVNE